MLMSAFTLVNCLRLPWNRYQQANLAQPGRGWDCRESDAAAYRRRDGSGWDRRGYGQGVGWEENGVGSPPRPSEKRYVGSAAV
jgi:hypothetical protein